MFSVPSKCGFLSQFEAIFFLNIRRERDEAGEPSEDEDMSKQAVVVPSSIPLFSLQFFYRAIMPLFLVAKKLFEGRSFFFVLRALCKSRNNMEVK